MNKLIHLIVFLGCSYVLGSLVGTGDKGVKKTGKVLVLMSLYAIFIHEIFYYVYNILKYIKY